MAVWTKEEIDRLRRIAKSDQLYAAHRDAVEQEGVATCPVCRGPLRVWEYSFKCDACKNVWHF